jgi:hypothetical protein
MLYLVEYSSEVQGEGFKAKLRLMSSMLSLFSCITLVTFQIQFPASHVLGLEMKAGSLRALSWSTCIKVL